MMKKISYFAFALLGMMLLSLSCNAQNKKNKDNSQTNTLVTEINESFFKENISDYLLNQEDFVFKGNKPVVVDFYATWCGPCRLLAPKLKKIAEKYDGEVLFYKLDIDKNPEITSVYGIRSVPTILFIPASGKPYLSQGNLPEDQIEEMISKIYEKKKVISKKNMQNNKPMTTKFKEITTVTTNGNLPAVGEKAPNFVIANDRLKDVSLEDFKGKRIILNIFPSVDTGTCAASVRQFNKEAASLNNTVVLCVSKDLPFAQRRFCAAEGIDNVVMLSAFRNPSFAEAYGLLMIDGPLEGLFARSVVVIDESGKVIHTELVPDIVQEPDYDAALAVLK